jgi:hypothetical protein
MRGKGGGVQLTVEKGEGPGGAGVSRSYGGGCIAEQVRHPVRWATQEAGPSAQRARAAT